MADNVNIIVQDTINDIVVNAAVIVETIDINVQAAVDEVQIIANPNNYVVNINRVIGEQVQSDWDQADDQAPDYIKNKPSIPALTSDLTNDGEDGVHPFITAADVTPQVNSDWNATSGVAQILNKPTIPAAQVNSDWNATSGVAQILNKPILATVATSGSYTDLSNTPSIPTLTSDLTNDGEDGINPFITAADIPASVTSVGLTMPSAFSVANSPITSAGTLEVTGAGLVSQYVRGDGSLANFPTSTGGGSSLAFYLNGSVSQGTFGGVAFKEMDRTPILGAGTDFTIAANGYIQSFITDANVPNLLEIPAGNWNFETYFSASSGGGSPSFYVELYKWNGTTLSLIASNSATPEGITNGTAIDAYFSALAVPQTTLLATDRLAVRIYVTHSGRTITLHTENGHLCEVITTFSTGLTALNGLTAQVQSFTTGTSGTDFAISSTTATHTFNLPTASATNRGALSSTDWSTFNGKGSGTVTSVSALTLGTTGTDLSSSVATGTTTPVITLNVPTASAANRGALSSTDWSTFNGKFTLPALTSGSVLFSNGTTIAQSNAQLFWDNTNNRLGIGTTTPSLKLQVETSVNGSDGIWARNLNTGSLAYGTVVANSAVGGLSLRAHSAAHAPWANTSMLLSDSGFSNGLILFQNGANPIAFWTNSNERMRIFANGNVAINVATDAGYKLDVNGTARVSGVLTVVGNILPSVGSTYNIGSSSFPFSNGLFKNTVFSNVFASFDTHLSFANSGITFARITNTTGNFIIQNGGTYTDEASARLTVNSTTQGFLPPRMTTTQKNAITTPAAGLVVYDTTLGKLCVRTASTWETITSI